MLGGLEIPAWLSAALAMVPFITVIVFWMNLSSKITEAKVTADAAKQEALEAFAKVVVLEASYNSYKEFIASNYVNREVMREMEGRITHAIDKITGRLDRVLERSERGKDAT